MLAETIQAADAPSADDSSQIDIYAPQMYRLPPTVGQMLDNQYVAEPPMPPEPARPSVRTAASQLTSPNLPVSGGARRRIGPVDDNAEVVDFLPAAAPPPPPSMHPSKYPLSCPSGSWTFDPPAAPQWQHDDRSDDAWSVAEEANSDEIVAREDRAAARQPLFVDNGYVVDDGPSHGVAQLDDRQAAPVVPEKTTEVPRERAMFVPREVSSPQAAVDDVGPIPPTGAPAPNSVEPRSAVANTNTPTVAEISAHVLPAVRRAYGLAQRGAYFAAQTEFIEVLRRIARAKDAECGTDRHARALAEGLRALDEADDFVLVGVQLEADLDVRAIATSHRTNVLEDDAHEVLPHDAVAIYHGFAQRRLGLAVAGEQAGSMVLYGLGKIHSSLGERSDDDLQSNRKAMTMYQAALLAHPANYLASNELGVLLERSGHHAQAIAMFERSVAVNANATAFRNLAVVRERLGDTRRASLDRQQAARLAEWERATGAISRRKGVEWVPPAEMVRAGPPPKHRGQTSASANDSWFPPPPGADNPTARQLTPRQAVATPPEESAWSRAVRMARAVAQPSRENPRTAGQPPAARVPNAAPHSYRR